MALERIGLARMDEEYVALKAGDEVLPTDYYRCCAKHKIKPIMDNYDHTIGRRINIYDVGYIFRKITKEVSIDEQFAAIY